MSIEGTTIVNAVIAKIAEEYPDATIYDETMKQGAERPYFFVSTIDTDKDKDMNQMYNQINQIKVQYFDNINNNTTAFTTLNNIGAVLMDILEEIDVEIGDGSSTTYIVRGIQMNWKNIEEVLNFFVTYPIRIFRQTEAEPLQNTLTITESVEQ